MLVRYYEHEQRQIYDNEGQLLFCIRWICRKQHAYDGQ